MGGFLDWTKEAQECVCLAHKLIIYARLELVNFGLNKEIVSFSKGMLKPFLKMG